VAPITIGQRATVGAGSVMTDDVPATTLALARSKQKIIYHWKSARMRKEIEQKSNH